MNKLRFDFKNRQNKLKIMAVLGILTTPSLSIAMEGDTSPAGPTPVATNADKSSLTASNIPNKKILIADDKKVDLRKKVRIVALCLTEKLEGNVADKEKLVVANHHIDEAVNAQSALEKIKSATTPYDLILTDGEMGGEGKNANTLIEALRKEGSALKSSIPIIIESGTLNDWLYLGQYEKIYFVAKNQNDVCKKEIKQALGL